MPQSNYLLNKSIKNQIAYLQEEFDNNLGAAMQKKYPEGQLFSCLLFALSLIEYSEFNKEYVTSDQVEKLILNTTTQKSRDNFEDDLALKYGAFYNGWINYTLKKYTSSELYKTSKQKEKIEAIKKKFTSRIINSQIDSIKLQETYSNAIWPADNLVCIASLDNQYSEIRKAWLEKILSSSKDNLINHYSGNKEEIRGSSQALINYFLIEIDGALAKKSYLEYKTRFQKEYFGIMLVREFEDGLESVDIDSGPIVFGIGSVATIMNNKLGERLNEKNTKNTLGFLNLIGLPVNLFGKKRYLFGIEPMYDIFLLWSSVGILNKKEK
jgi:hypothetical protein